MKMSQSIARARPVEQKFVDYVLSIPARLQLTRTEAEELADDLAAALEDEAGIRVRDRHVRVERLRIVIHTAMLNSDPAKGCKAYSREAAVLAWRGCVRNFQKRRKTAFLKYAIYDLGGAIWLHSSVGIAGLLLEACDWLGQRLKSAAKPS